MFFSSQARYIGKDSDIWLDSKEIIWGVPIYHEGKGQFIAVVQEAKLKLS